MALSRVKRYEELRKSIELEQIDDTKTTTVETQTSEILKAFDSTVFKRSDIQDEIQAKRKKTIASSHQGIDLTQVKTKDSFTNEYLDDFMKEVKEYNIKKGNRVFEDTDVDILYQLHPSSRQKRAKYVEEIKDEVNKQENEMIALEVASLLDDVENIHEDVLDEVFEEIKQEQQEEKVEIEENQKTIESNVVEEKQEYIDETKINLLNREELEVVKDQIEEVKEQSKDNHERLLDETLQMKKQLTNYEEELNDLSKGVVKTNRLLNFIFFFLIFIFLGLTGYLGYLIYQAGGF